MAKRRRLTQLHWHDAMIGIVLAMISALTVAVLYVLEGQFVMALTALVLAIAIGLNAIQYRGWRLRINAFMVHEREDQAKFSSDLVLMKSAALALTVRRYDDEMLNDPAVQLRLIELYRNVATSWLSEEASDEAKQARAAAQLVVDAERLPEYLN